MKTYHIYIDEAGRGPLAWPMYVGLILPLKKLTVKELSIFKDSKKLTEPQREECFRQIQLLQKKGKLIAIPSFATVKEIDTYGVTNALHIAIVRGLQQSMLCGSRHSDDGGAALAEPKEEETLYTHTSIETKNEKMWGNLHLHIDGKSDFKLKKTYPSRKITTIIDGDDTVKEIAMASILAKVFRDRVMNALPKKYQKYGFAQHKGYGTQLHREKIAQYGPCDLHRKLFLKSYFPQHTFQTRLPTSDE